MAGVGGIFNARDEARFWAMLAGGGALDGVRLLAADRVASFSNIRDHGDEPDPVMFGIPIPITVGGYCLGGHSVSSQRAIVPTAAAGSPRRAHPHPKPPLALCPPPHLP